MNSNRTIVKETVSKDADLRHSAEWNGKAPGRKEGEGTHIDITLDRIRMRAHEIFVARNGGPGDATTDWCQAERELNEKAGVGPGFDDLIADPVVLETRTLSEPRSHAATAGRGGL
ncbi:MAG: DUF2934 domain-containing protein [Tepidisphaera sp.]